MSRQQSLPATLLVGALVLLPAGLVGWAGVWVLGLSALVLVVLLLGRRFQFRSTWLAALAGSAALLGGVVGVFGTDYPALQHVRHAGQAHDRADRPRDAGSGAYRRQIAEPRLLPKRGSPD